MKRNGSTLVGERKRKGREKGKGGRLEKVEKQTKEQELEEIDNRREVGKWRCIGAKEEKRERESKCMCVCVCLCERSWRAENKKNRRRGRRRVKGAGTVH